MATLSNFSKLNVLNQKPVEEGHLKKKQLTEGTSSFGWNPSGSSSY